MRAIPTDIGDVVLFEPEVHEDPRGFFFESWNQQSFDMELGCAITFVQDNHSRSAANVLRGIHYQLRPHAQGKLVRVIRGVVFDVAVDLRRSAPTFGQWVGAELSDASKRQLWIPPGFGHAFLSLTEGSEVLYKTTDYFSRDCDRTLAWNDPDLDIDWPLESDPILSAKDAEAARLRDAELFS